MSERTLAKLYETLNPLERASLILSALERNDEAEVERLNVSAPLLRWRMSHHCGVTRALAVVSLLYRTEQLELIANYFFLRSDELDNAGTDLWVKGVATSAFRFSVNAEAWRLFCEEKGICQQGLTAGMPGETLTDLCELNMPNVAPSRVELRNLLGDVASSRIITVDDVLAGWNSLYVKLLDGWPE